MAINDDRPGKVVHHLQVVHQVARCCEPDDVAYKGVQIKPPTHGRVRRSVSIYFLQSRTLAKRTLVNMSSINIPWTRLVRYSSSADGPVKYGEPVASPNADLGQLANEGKLQVKQLSGSDPFSLQTTDVTEGVFCLYGPLAPKDVPIIRCIGLNYKTHSKWICNFYRERLSTHRL